VFVPDIDDIRDLEDLSLSERGVGDDGDVSLPTVLVEVVLLEQWMHLYLGCRHRDVDQFLGSLDILETVVAHADPVDDTLFVEFLEHWEYGVDVLDAARPVVIQ
jgi:hypothetical protein